MEKNGGLRFSFGRIKERPPDHLNCLRMGLTTFGEGQDEKNPIYELRQLFKMFVREEDHGRIDLIFDLIAILAANYTQSVFDSMSQPNIGPQPNPETNPQKLDGLDLKKFADLIASIYKGSNEIYTSTSADLIDDDDMPALVDDSGTPDKIKDFNQHRYSFPTKSTGYQPNSSRREEQIHITAQATPEQFVRHSVCSENKSVPSEKQKETSDEYDLSSRRNKQQKRHFDIRSNPPKCEITSSPFDGKSFLIPALIDELLNESNIEETRPLFQGGNSTASDVGTKSSFYESYLKAKEQLKKDLSKQAEINPPTTNNSNKHMDCADHFVVFIDDEQFCIVYNDDKSCTEKFRVEFTGDETWIVKRDIFQCSLVNLIKQDINIRRAKNLKIQIYTKEIDEIKPEVEIKRNTGVKLFKSIGVNIDAEKAKNLTYEQISGRLIAYASTYF